MNTAVPLTAVRAFRNYAVRQLGIEINSELEPLVGCRILKRMGHFKEPLYRYLTRVYLDKESSELVSFFDLVRGRAAPFFARRSDHAQLYAWVRGWLVDGCRRLRFWSAGCGTGEEPYGMALTVLDAIASVGLAPDEVDFKVLATDVSPHALEVGKAGLFERPQLCCVPSPLRSRHFFRAYGGIAISDEIRERVVFRCLNLAQPPYPMRAGMDAIFCHEALIPMAARARETTVRAIHDVLAPGGLMCTGFGPLALDGDEPLVPAKPALLGRCEC